MLNSIFFFFFSNIVLISFLFWGLSFVGDKFFKKKNNKYSDEVFECGFMTNHDYNIKINLNIFFVFNLLIIYDVEFMFIIPYFYNMNVVSVYTIITFSLFLFLVMLSLVVDWTFLSIVWHS